MNSLRVVRRIGVVLFMASVGCGAAPDDLEPVGLETQRSNLWLGANVTRWPFGVVPVCFSTGFDGPQQQTIKDAIMNESSWGGWSVSPNTSFTGWGSCPSPIPAGRVAIKVDPSISPALGLTDLGYFSNRPTLLRFASPTPPTKTIMHEFGHALGFAHEHKDDGTCNQRTSGGTQLSPWDEPNSIMSQTKCNGANPVLSANDILGIQRAYATDADGSSTIHTYNTDPNNSEGDASHNGRLVLCHGGEVLVGIEQWAWNSHTIQCKAMSGSWAGDFSGRRYAYSTTDRLQNGVATCPWGFVAFGVDFTLNLLYCSESTAYQGNGYLSDSNQFGHFQYHGISSEIHVCPTGALQGANVSFGAPTAGQGYNFSCINP